MASPGATVHGFLEPFDPRPPFRAGLSGRTPETAQGGVFDRPTQGSMQAYHLVVDGEQG